MNYSLGRKSQLDARELLLLDLEVKNRGKDITAAYLLWYFLGIFGGHRFYMGKTGTAVTQLVLSITVIGLIATSIWWIVDAFLTRNWVREHNEVLENQFIDQIMYTRGPSGNYPV
ncbi:TM2 domain-containing protein [Paenibacillus sp. M1]|uniref:TM2 domain-containing protein n=2 Tax=Paenibacillus haidiansis TaxID=1574488 RepID=A0ABU7VYA4_9BACL